MKNKKEKRRMYYLRKEPYERVLPEVKKTDGTVIPERKYTVEDRALYKHNNLNRFYRQEYTGEKRDGMHLYKTSSIEEIKYQREALYNYSGEWFDIYDEYGKVEQQEE